MYESLLDLIQKPWYARQSFERRGKEIEARVKKAKDTARAEMAVAKIRDGMTEEQLREGKLINDDVQRRMSQVAR
jgi:hypothetical protein